MRGYAPKFKRTHRWPLGLVGCRSQDPNYMLMYSRRRQDKKIERKKMRERERERERKRERERERKRERYSIGYKKFCSP